MIPYNPSSFNSNKTILEQILEIKKWLIAHPSYKVYYCTSNFMPTGDDDRAFTEIAGTEEEVQNIAVGDLLVFPDSYYSEVIAVDLDNEMVTIALPATNFKGPQGATGPSGADGTNGTCIRYCNTNKNSNPSTTYAVSDITFSTGLQINDCILFKNNRIGFVDYISGGTFRVTQNIIIDGKDGQYVDTATINSDGDLIITLYDPESMIQSNINAGHVVGADGNDGVSITNVAIDGNNHLIVTLSDGNTIDAGSVSGGTSIDVINPNSPSYRQLTQTEMDNFKGCSLYIIASGHIYRYDSESSTYLYGTYLYYNGSSSFNMNRLRITKSTGDWTEGTPIVLSGQATSFGSSGATSGQVLTADGSGSCSWETPSGSGANVVILSSNSGTMSADDLAKANQEDCILMRSGDAYRFYSSDTTYNYFYPLLSGYSAIDTNYRISVNKTTGYYTRSTYSHSMLGGNIKSTGATNGQVLMADGSGNASWQNVGGSTLYQHNIIMYASGSYQISLTIINDQSTAFVNFSELKTWLYNKGYNSGSSVYTNITGGAITNSKTNLVESISATGASAMVLYVRDMTSATLSSTSINITSGSISDKVVAL